MFKTSHVRAFLVFISGNGYLCAPFNVIIKPLLINLWKSFLSIFMPSGCTVLARYKKTNIFLSQMKSTS